MKVIARRSNALSRRCIDAIAALSLLVLLSPVLITTAALVRLFIGSPVAFWQQRPGRGGVPFRLYKFRTMRAPHDETGRLLSDEERTSPVGNFLRRFRLDELPQLFNILVGDMSFVGPRPLLPRDQAPSDCARLLVRPGLTGWAQVVGGRAVSADDKAALDVWYVKNASLLLDLQIAIRTVPMILFGESIHRSTITDVWHELRRDGIVSG
ncbi:MAG: sugar transferase [Hyphomicrobiaceae bacterium]